MAYSKSKKSSITIDWIDFPSEALIVFKQIAIIRALHNMGLTDRALQEYILKPETWND